MILKRRLPLKPKRRLTRDERLDRFWCYIFIIPSTVWFIMFNIYPMVASYGITLYDWDGMRPLAETPYVGLGNFKEIATNPFFWESALHTFIFIIIEVPLSILASLTISLILNSKVLPGRNVFRAMFYLPSLVSGAIMGIVISLLVNPYNGTFNEILIRLGVIKKGIDFLGAPVPAMATIIFTAFWLSLGGSMILFLAALQGITAEINEAATLDGVSGPQRLFSITLPLILPVVLYVTIGAFGGGLGIFDIVVVLTLGGPAGSTEVIRTFIYKWAFIAPQVYNFPRQRVGLASAAGVFVGIIGLGFTLLNLLLLRNIRRKREEYGM